jgi:drug/metabolite transporter (DMT)-like permease
VARTGIGEMDAVQAMLGASIAGLIMCVPLALVTGQWFALPLPPGRAEWALVASSALHSVLYATYVWLAARAGAVFASQTSYVVTVAGVFWAMLILGERLTSGIWIAAALMIGGVALVRPRARQV